MSLVEKRYAEALINISVAQDQVDAFQQDLKAFADVYSGDPYFKEFLLNPKNEISIKKDVVQKAFSGKVKADIINYVSLLLDKGRIKHLPAIYEEFVRMADEKRSVLNMNIISAVPLDPAQLKTITEKYAKLYSASSVKAEVTVDASLIGGVRVVIGDKMIDATVKGRLNDLQRLLVR